MLRVNADIKDHLIHSKTGNTSNIECTQVSIRKVYVKFSDEPAGIKAIRSSHLGRKSCWVSIEKCETGILIKKGSAIVCTPSPIFCWGGRVERPIKFSMKNLIFQG